MVFSLIPPVSPSVSSNTAFLPVHANAVDVVCVIDGISAAKPVQGTNIICRRYISGVVKMKAKKKGQHTHKVNINRFVTVAADSIAISV